MKEQHNPPAFPTPEIVEEIPNGSRVWAAQFGMSLRDYFAAKAMQAQVATDMVPGEACAALVEAAAHKGLSPEYLLALNSYEIADALLAARKETK